MEESAEHKRLFVHFLRTAATDWIVAGIVCTIMYLYFYVWQGQKYFPKYKRSWSRIIREIKLSVCAVFLDFAKVPLFAALYSSTKHAKLYFDIEEYGLPYFFLSIFLFIALTECLVFLSHYALHTKFLFRYLHVHHHISYTTHTLSAFSFHPLDSFGQAWPYFLAPFLFPVHHRIQSMGLLIISIWTVCIHDDISLFNGKIMLNARYHTLHHKYNDYNFGQLFTFFDWLAGTVKHPEAPIKKIGPMHLGHQYNTYKEQKSGLLAEEKTFVAPASTKSE